jgi:lipoprotein-anchoring transpeptidase ErfK/SrfK
MDNQNNEARDLIVKAREALRRGDKETAHNLGEQAALLAPGMEDAWLILTASDPSPEEALAYAQQALEINPSSERALRAVEWAIARLKQAQSDPGAAAGAAASIPAQQEKLQETKKSINRTWLYVGAAFVLFLCVMAAFFAYRSASQISIASLVNNAGLNKVTETSPEKNWAPMSLPKPTLSPDENGGSSQQPVNTPVIGPTQELPASAPTIAPTDTASSASTSTPMIVTPTSAPGEVPAGAETATPQASGGPAATEPAQAADAPAVTEAPQVADASTVTETPAVMSMEMVTDVQASQPANQPVPPSSNAPLPAAASSGSGTRWIDVDLTNQMVYAYEGDYVVNSFLVSTGTWMTPTVTGQYNIYVKYRAAPMSGPGYYLPDVPYIMYFYKGYGLHGTYWHSNFGTPMSHGCVNLRTDEAAWLYNWASVGTLVNIHY